jgi:hypothetical protein
MLGGHVVVLGVVFGGRVAFDRTTVFESWVACVDFGQFLLFCLPVVSL